MFREHLQRGVSQNWGLVPYSKADVESYTIDMQLVFSRDWFMLAEHGAKPVAVAITIPPYVQIYKIP